ncbi:MAG TPA: PQQ-dependent sugar dehydrogenase [Phycisphaerae bacterium]|nr:PQQ-dependent sugar dehydrogenase [Phycisphaerae bacterium]
MFTKRFLPWGMCSLCVILASVRVATAASPTPLTTVRVSSGLSLPLFVTAPPGDTSRIFIVEQRSGNIGRIRILNIPANTLNATPFLSITGVTTSDEQGLLGLAFDPDYATNGFFYVNYTTTGGGAAGHTVIARYTVSANPDIADAASAVILKTINQPESNHNGGCLQFGPDGMLYASSGDGGGGGDAHGTIGNGQSLTTLLGKILRLDVDNPPTYIPADNPNIGGSGVNEKWAYGTRNPWRMSFDRLNGDFYMADVGQGSVEEVNYSTFATAAGRNYAWRCMEGNACFNSPSGPNCTCDITPPLDPTLTYPVHTYSSAAFQPCSVTGGYVYRGPIIPDLQGTYFFADYFCSTTAQAPIWSFIISGGLVTNFTTRTTELAPGGGLVISSITSFGEDADGELYICDRGSGANGEVYKIIVNCAGSSLTFSTQPASQNATTGQTVNFTVAMTAVRGLTTYTWRKNGNIVGTNSPTLTLTNVTCHDNGTYNCTVQDQCNTAVSDDATLEVTPVPLGDIEGDCDCDMVDLDTLVNVLLEIDLDPGHIDRADVNGDNVEDGLDIQAFIDTIPQWPC